MIENPTKIIPIRFHGFVFVFSRLNVENISSRMSLYSVSCAFLNRIMNPSPMKRSRVTAG